MSNDLRTTLEEAMHENGAFIIAVPKIQDSSFEDVLDLLELYVQYNIGLIQYYNGYFLTSKESLLESTETKEDFLRLCGTMMESPKGFSTIISC